VQIPSKRAISSVRVSCHGLERAIAYENENVYICHRWRITVNGTDLLRLSTTQPWSYFNTPRSIITDPNTQRLPGGVLALINAVKSKQNVVICGIGTVSLNPVPTGLLVKVEVFGQVDANL
jgi:hypothetical protein